MLAIESPIPQFFALDGTPLNAGKLYFGTAGADPEASPIPVYWDAAGTVPASQPIATSNGYPVNGSTLASVYIAASDYSVTVRTSVGALVLYAPTRPNLLALSLASSSAGQGDALIVAKRSESGAIATTAHAVNQTRPLCPKADYGAVGDGVTDDYAALAAWITGLKGQASPRVVLPDGLYNIGNTTLTFDLPDGATGYFAGTIVSSASAKSAIIIGKLSANANFYNIKGIKVYRATLDTTGSSVGVELLNLIASDVGIQEAYNFARNVKGHGNGFGFAYNNIYLGAIRDGVKNLNLTSSNGGYCNECNWFGGTFNHKSSYDPLINTVNLEIDNVTPRIGNHRFYGPSFEDSAAGTLSTAAIINGDQNVIFWPRLERDLSQSTYLIKLTANSTGCGVVGGGFGVNAENIQDLGITNSWDAYDQTSTKCSTPDTSGKGVIRARSTNTSSARVLLIEDASGAETATIRGDGRVTVPTIQSYGVAAGSTSYANDAAAAAGGVAVGGFYRNGSVVQVRVA